VLLDAAQRRLPKIYIEHDPPRGHPTDTRHPVDDDQTLLVHVTDFNALMWDSGRTPVVVIEHGVKPPLASWRGEQARGITVINNLASRGRRLGADIFFRTRQQLALDLAGMGSLECGGIGEFAYCDLAAVCAGYRFFFNPIRYTSLGLAVIEAMMMGMPVVALATTEMSTVIDNGKTGISANDPGYLIEGMHALLKDHGLAQTLGTHGRHYASERFALSRFIADWERVLKNITA
jgi:glycosyltransferase involved in cell wall biosynthesis